LLIQLFFFLRAFVKTVATRCDSPVQNTPKYVCDWGFSGVTSVFRGHFMAWEGRGGKGREGECSLTFYSLPLVARLVILKLFCVE